MVDAALGDDVDDAGAERRRLAKGALLGVALGIVLALIARVSGHRPAAEDD